MRIKFTKCSHHLIDLCTFNFHTGNELYFDNINVGITVYIPSAFDLPINIWHRINHNDFNNGVLDLCLYDMLYELKCEIFDKLGEV